MSISRQALYGTLCIPDTCVTKTQMLTQEWSWWTDPVSPSTPHTETLAQFQYCLGLPIYELMKDVLVDLRGFWEQWCVRLIWYWKHNPLYAFRLIGHLEGVNWQRELLKLVNSGLLECFVPSKTSVNADFFAQGPAS